MKNIFIIMSLELTKMRRNHMSWFAVMISVMLLFLMDQFNYFTIEEQFKMIKDFSLGIMNIVSLILVIYFPVSMLKDDIREKTIFSILSAPVSKTQLLFGKYAAFSVLLTVCVLSSTLSLFLILTLKGAPIDIQLLYAVIMILLKFLTLTGYAFLCSVFPLSNFLCTFVVFFCFCLGTVKTYFISMLNKYVGIDVPFIIQKCAFAIVPNFRIFDVVESITLGKTVDISLLYSAFFHFLGITMLTMFIASIIFENQEL